MPLNVRVVATLRPSTSLTLLALLALAHLSIGLSSASGAQYRTPNFVVTATSSDVAEKVGQAAEYYRKELAIEWTGREMPSWTKPCPIKVKVGNIGAGGATTFSFDRGEVFGWKMNVQGTLERILDSVIPHEVNHTIFACHFRRPLPRWADEGAATLTEHASEKNRQTRLLNQVIRTTRRIPLRRLLVMKEYPKDMNDVLTLYAEGYALADLLVQEGGKARYLNFLNDGHHRGWDFALRKHYKYNSVDDLERRWSDWVIAGSPRVTPPGTLVAANESATTTRGQSDSLLASAGRPTSPLASEGRNEMVEFGVGPTALVDEDGRIDRSRLSRPVHQVPVTAGLPPSPGTVAFKLAVEVQRSSRLTRCSWPQIKQLVTSSRLWILLGF